MDCVHTKILNSMIVIKNEWIIFGEIDFRKAVGRVCHGWFMQRNSSNKDYLYRFLLYTMMSHRPAALPGLLIINRSISLHLPL